MNDWIKLAIAAWLMPSVVVTAFCLADGLGIVLGILGGIVLAGLLAVVAVSALLVVCSRPLVRWMRGRFSPVRRRGPMPVAWRQWR